MYLAIVKKSNICNFQENVYIMWCSPKIFALSFVPLCMNDFDLLFMAKSSSGKFKMQQLYPKDKCTKLLHIARFKKKVEHRKHNQNTGYIYIYTYIHIYIHIYIYIYIYIYIKVKCTPVRALRLCTGRTAHRGSRGIALLFHDQRHQKRVKIQRHAPAALYLQERAGTHCTGGWVGPRVGLDRCGKSLPPGPSSPQPVAIPTTLHAPHRRLFIVVSMVES